MYNVLDTGQEVVRPSVPKTIILAHKLNFSVYLKFLILLNIYDTFLIILLSFKIYYVCCNIFHNVFKCNNSDIKSIFYLPY